MTGCRITIELDAEHAAMLDALVSAAGAGSRSGLAKSLLVAVLEDDAASHGAVLPSDRVVVFPGRTRR